MDGIIGTIGSRHPLIRMEARLRASPTQFRIIMEFMEKNGDLNQYPGSGNRLRNEVLWNELTKLLNNVQDGVKKNMEKWKKVWADWKTKTKKKAMLNKRAANSEGPHCIKIFTPLEKRLLKFMMHRLKCKYNRNESPFENTPSSPEQPVTVSEPDESIPEASSSQAIPEFSDATEHYEILTPSEESSNLNRIHVHSIEQCRKQYQKLFEQVSNNYRNLEETRLRLEEKRIDNEFKIEIERLKLNSQRIILEEQRNDILKGLANTVNKVAELLLLSQNNEG